MSKLTQRIVFFPATLLLALSLFGGCGADDDQCSSDNDCKADRICEAGACVDPNGSSNNTPSNNQPSNNQPSNNQPSNNQPSNNQPSNNDPFNNDPFNNDPFNNTPGNNGSNANTGGSKDYGSVCGGNSECKSGLCYTAPGASSGVCSDECNRASDCRDFGSSTQVHFSCAIPSNGSARICIPSRAGEKCQRNEDCPLDVCLFKDPDTDVFGYCSMECSSFTDCPTFWNCELAGNATVKVCIQD